MSLLFNTVIIVIGVCLGLFLLAFFIGSIMHCCGKDEYYELEDLFKVYQIGDHSNNINVGGNCIVTSCDEYTMIKKDKYTVVITKDGISVNGKNIDLKEEDA